MSASVSIARVTGEEILDSRGNPTVRVTVALNEMPVPSCCISSCIPGCAGAVAGGQPEHLRPACCGAASPAFNVELK